MRNLQYEMRICQIVIIKSQRHFIYGSIFYESDVNRSTDDFLRLRPTCLAVFLDSSFLFNQTLHKILSMYRFFVCIALFEGNKKEKNGAVLYYGIELTIEYRHCQHTLRLDWGIIGYRSVGLLLPKHVLQPAHVLDITLKSKTAPMLHYIASAQEILIEVGQLFF